MNTSNEKIGTRIREFRNFQKLSREALAEKAGISTQFLADIEGGKKGMTISTLIKLCNALHVSSDSIIFGNKNVTSPNIDAMLSTLSQEQQQEIEKILISIINLSK